jgi:Mg/Co/Ni transporter MgtE
MLSPEDCAGGLMDPDVLTIWPDVNLDVVLRYLRARGELPEVFDLLFVVDRQGHYLGSLKLADLLTRDPTSRVADLMDTSIRPIGHPARPRWSPNSAPHRIGAGHRPDNAAGRITSTMWWT